MRTTIITDNQRGLLFKNGKFSKLLSPGKYYLLKNSSIEIILLDRAIMSIRCSLETLLSNHDISSQADVVDIKDLQIAFHFVDGKFVGALQKGKFAFWNIEHTHEFQIVDISSPEVDADIPDYIFSMLPNTLYMKVEIEQYQRARVYFNKKLHAILEPGTYYFWKNSINVKVDFVDTRLLQLNVTGQEILSNDKVSLRINFVCNYRITDYVKVLTDVEDYVEQLHVSIQLAMREYVGRQKLDDILEGREQISEYVLKSVRDKAPSLYVEIVDGGVKDIILPGEIRNIMNTVLVAEKRAQASVITRREEVASTRSLLNTAKLMDDNQTLYRLKELEYIERIFGNVGNISLSSNSDMISQLGKLLGDDRSARS